MFKSLAFFIAFVSVVCLVSAQTAANYTNTSQTIVVDANTFDFETLEQANGNATVVRFRVENPDVRAGDVLFVLSGSDIHFHGMIGIIEDGRGVVARRTTLRQLAHLIDLDLVADPVKEGEDSELSSLILGDGFGRITDIETGPDGLLYILSYEDGKIYRISKGAS